MDIARAFGEVLRRNRERLELSQEELALRCGLDRTFISMLERGLRQPSISTIFTVAKEIGITSSEFVRQVERETKKKGRRTLPRLPSSRA